MLFSYEHAGDIQLRFFSREDIKKKSWKRILAKDTIW